MGVSSCEYPKKPYLATKQKRSDSLIANPGFKPMFQEFAASLPLTLAVEKPNPPSTNNLIKSHNPSEILHSFF